MSHFVKVKIIYCKTTKTALKNSNAKKPTLHSGAQYGLKNSNCLIAKNQTNYKSRNVTSNKWHWDLTLVHKKACKILHKMQCVWSSHDANPRPILKINTFKIRVANCNVTTNAMMVAQKHQQFLRHFGIGNPLEEAAKLFSLTFHSFVRKMFGADGCISFSRKCFFEYKNSWPFWPLKTVVWSWQ